MADTDEERSITAVALSEALLFGAGDFAGASDLLKSALDTISEPQHRAMVAGSHSLAHALTGDFEPALRYGDELLDAPGLDPLGRLNLSVMWTIAAISTGQTEQLQARLDVGRILARENRSVMPLALDQIEITQFMFDSADGRLTQAVAFAEAEHELALQEHRVVVLWDYALAIGEILTGRGRSASAHAERGVARLAHGDAVGVRTVVTAAQAMVYATTGDLAGALSAHDSALADPRCGPREQPFLARAMANVLALEGHVDDAVATLLACDPKPNGSAVWTAWALYDAVRFQRPVAVAAKLRALAISAPVESVLAMNDHCEALVSGDAALLSKAAERLGRAALVHFAAEAAAHASRQLHIDGDATGAAFMALRAFAFFDRCDGVRSLAMEALERPLTGREFEVAQAAAAGHPSQAIADRLFVSRRTVDNHLQSAYRKLGINQRDELAQVFSL